MATERNVLEQMNILLNDALHRKDNLKDKKIILETIELIEELLVSNIQLDTLEKIKNNLNELDRKYDDLYHLINLYDSVYFNLKQRLHQEYVRYLREQNRKKETKTEYIRKMLEEKIDINLISKITGLSIDELKNIK